jgi:phage tail-like protein
MFGTGTFQNKNWPLPKFHFAVNFGAELWSFQEVTGLETEVEVLEYRHGKSKQFGSFKMPGIPKVSDAVLKKGVFTSDTMLFEWFKKNNLNKTERKDVTISLLNEYQIPEIIWTLSNAFPKKIESSGLNSQGSEIAVESIVLSYEELAIDNIVSMGLKALK